jgi:hypothetical protein
MTRYAVVDRQDGLYAIEEFESIALIRKAEAAVYLDEAATCGHPDAPSWVNARLPLEVRPVTDEQAEMLVEDHGTPILDREP